MPTPNLSRLETSLLAQDAELLKRIAERRGVSVSEIIRQAIYSHVPQLARAAQERSDRTAQEIIERRKLREWEAKTGE